MTVRTRIAPSPTGFFHIGNLRTALWDYFLAHQHGGQFVLRIEDTDQERLVEGSVEALLRTLERVGLDHDEGPFLNAAGEVFERGDCGPYVQSKRLDIYREYAEQLHKDGHAYVCFCLPDRLEEMRAAQIVAKQNPKYDRHCLRLSKKEIDSRLASGERHVLRMQIPAGTSEFIDAIRGKVSFQNADVDDQVILKSDGFPTYHLAVVVDDHLMNITHVLRGEEWLSSTPKQIILYKMLGWDMPTYAHVPLLLNPDKTKLSKRKGDVFVETFLDKGYLPEALMNFIATLGFNPTSDREIYSFEELVKMFDISKVNKSGAVVNMEKLDWMNQHYIREKSADELTALLTPYLATAGKSVETKLLRRIVEVEKQRLTLLADIVQAVEPYLVLADYDPTVLIWKKADATDAKANLEAIRGLLEATAPSAFTLEALEASIKAFIVEKGLQKGNVLWPLRVALSGQAQSPSPFEMAYALEKDEVLRRLEVAINKLT